MSTETETEDSWITCDARMVWQLRFNDGQLEGFRFSSILREPVTWTRDPDQDSIISGISENTIMSERGLSFRDGTRRALPASIATQPAESSCENEDGVVPSGPSASLASASDAMHWEIAPEVARVAMIFAQTGEVYGAPPLSAPSSTGAVSVSLLDRIARIQAASQSASSSALGISGSVSPAATGGSSAFVSPAANRARTEHDRAGGLRKILAAFAERSRRLIEPNPISALDQ